MKMIIILIIFTRSNILNDEYEVKYEIYDEEIYIILENEFFLVQARNNFENTSIYKSEYSNTSNEFKLGIILKTERKHRMNFFFKNSKQINFSTTIPKLNDNSGEIDIQFLKGNDIKKDPDFVTIFTNSSDFLTFSNQEAEINFKVINSTNNAIITQILRKRSRNKLIICYGGNNCFHEQDFQIQSDENYLTSINESKFLEIIKQFIPSTGLKSFKIIFNNNETPPIDFSIIPFKIIEKVELIGHSETRPQFIKLTNHDQKEIKTKLKTRNIQFLNDNVIFINHNNDNKRRTPTETGNSFDQIIYPIYPNFKENQNITLEIFPEYILIKDTKGNKIDQINFIKEKSTVLLIKNEDTSFQNTIFIKPESFLRRIDSSNISIDFEDCDSMSIQFSEWYEKKDVPEIMFNFYTDNETELNITSSKNKLIKYRHYHYNEGTFSINKQYPTDFAFCLKTALCDEQEFVDLDPIITTIDVDQKDISTAIENEFDDLTKNSIQNLIIFVNNELEGIEFDLSFLTGNDLRQIRFINPENDIVTLQLTELPITQENEWIIKNCSLSVKNSQQYIINELFSYYSSISWDNLIIKHGTYVMNIDLIDNEIAISKDTFELNGKKYNSIDNLTLKINTKQNVDYSFVFKPKEFSAKCSDICLNFESVNENSKEIPITFHNDWDITKEKINIQINVSKKEHIIINRIPKNVDFVVYSKELEKIIQQIYVNALNFVLCYQSDECIIQEDFLIDKDSSFISTKTEENYDQIIKSLKENDKDYNYLRLSFVYQKDAIKFVLNKIPSEKFKQLQLYGYGDDNALVLLEDEADTTIFNNWVIHHVTFAENLKIKYSFNELLVLDTNPVFQNVIEYSDNITIGTARFHCYYNQKVNGLSNVNFINYTIFELFPELNISDYTLSIRGFTFVANGNPIIQPPKNKFNFYVHKSPDQITHTFYINRYDNLFNDVSIEFEKFTDIMYIEYSCFSDECNKPFDYYFTVNDIDLIRTNQGNCNDVNTFINGQPHISSTPKPSGTPTHSYTEFFTYSSHFTSSQMFSSSFWFSDSIIFSNSEQFSESTQFSESLQFSKSSDFSESSGFSKSLQFSESYRFSNSISFSSSSIFSISSAFSISSQFTQSAYPPTTQFTGSCNFTESYLFSESSSFSKSLAFTGSLPFTPSFPLQYGQPSSDQINQWMNVDSSLFNMTSKGFIDENNLLSDLSQFIEPLTTVFFTSKSINITEMEKFTMPTILYFKASEKKSSIRFDRNLYNSVVGIKTDNSPTIILMNQESPINIMNYKQGYSTIDIVYENKTYDFGKVSLTMNEVNNSNGYFTINVDPKIKSLLFTTILMSRISSLEARYKSMTQYPKSNLHLLDNKNNNDDDDVRAEIIVENNINISQNSDVILNKIHIKGNLNIYDDSSLIFKDGITFSNKSKINFFFKNSKRSNQEPIIRTDSLLNSAPSEIIFTFEDNCKTSDISNYVLLEATNFKTCLSWADNVRSAGKDKRKIEAWCEYIEGGSTQFIFTAKKNKLSTGAIIGIAVGCAVVVIIIIIVIVVLVLKKKNADHDLPDRSGLELSTF